MSRALALSVGGEVGVGARARTGSKCRSERSRSAMTLSAAQVERRRQPVDLGAGDAELADQQVEHVLVHVGLDLEAHRRAEAAPGELALERGEEVLGVVLLDLEVLVAGDPEGEVLAHLHAREEVVEVRRDDVLERHEPGVVHVGERRTRPARLDAQQAGQHRRHLDPGEVLLAGARVDQHHGQVEREPGDVGERVGRVDGERGEHREEPVGEHPRRAARARRRRARPSARS